LLAEIINRSSTKWRNGGHDEKRVSVKRCRSRECVASYGRCSRFPPSAHLCRFQYRKS